MKTPLRSQRPWENSGHAATTPTLVPVASDKSAASSRWVARLLWVGMGIGVAIFLWSMVIGPLFSFHPKVLSFGPYQRTAYGPAIENPASEIFSPENLVQYLDKGTGFKVHLARNYRGITDVEKTVELSTFHSANDNRLQRKGAVSAARSQLETALAEVNSDPPRAVPYFFVVDVTEGMYPELASQVQDTYQLLDLKSSFQAGNGASFNVSKITASDIAAENFRSAVIIPLPAGSQPLNARAIDADLTKVQNSLDWLTQAHGEEKNTSVMTPLFERLAQASKERFANVYVFSDFLENAPGYTFTVYSGEGRKLLEDDSPATPDSKERRLAKHQQLRKLVQKYFSVPADLHGVYVEIHTPTRGSAALIHRSTAFMKWLLEDAGAQVKII